MEDATTPLVEGAARRPDHSNTARRSCSIAAATLAIILLVVVSSNWPEFEDIEHLSPLEAACDATFYPKTCRETLPRNAKPHEFTRIAVASAAQGVMATLTAVLENRVADGAQAAGENVCLETLASSIEELETSLALLRASQPPLDELKTRLSAAMEFHTTCLDALEETGARKPLTDVHAEELLSNALAFVNALSPSVSGELAANPDCDPDLNSRRFLNLDSSFPSWMSGEQRAHLDLSAEDPPVDVVVAKDGSGKFKSIQAAIDAAPKIDSRRYVIRIKTGVYDEQVTIPKKAVNFMLIGDGAEKSIITGSRSVAKTPNMTTFNSASLIVEGKGFIGKFFTARNTAGAEGHQAVAMRVSADSAAFYKCTFDSFQDTLYTHTFRQFYRECTVLGTIDFIFGNGAVSFQFCTLIAKKSPLRGQQNTYTAQGKTDQGQATGLSFQSCSFDATPELKANTANFKTYLARPWKPFSTHVNLKCNLMGHIDAEGWLPWNTSDFGLKTSFFAEWQDFGPGATADNIAKRVKWSKQIRDIEVAAKFQAVPFTQAGSWVPETGIPLTSSLP